MEGEGEEEDEAEEELYGIMGWSSLVLYNDLPLGTQYQQAHPSSFRFLEHISASHNPLTSYVFPSIRHRHRPASRYGIINYCLALIRTIKVLENDQKYSTHF